MRTKIMPEGDAPVRNLYARSPAVRRSVLEGLWASSHPLARLAAQALATDPSVDVRMLAMEALGEVGTRGDIPRLICALHDTAWSVRASAADSLGLLGGRRAWRALGHALTDDPNANVRRYAAVALATAGPAVAGTPLTAALQTERNPSSLVGIYWALYDLGDTTRLSELLDLLRSREPQVRFQVLGTLRAGVRAPDIPQVLDALQALLAREEHTGIMGNAQRLVETLVTHTRPASRDGQTEEATTLDKT